MSAGCFNKGFGFSVCVVLSWWLCLLPGLGHAWEYSDGNGICKLTSQGNFYVRRNGEIISGASFVFRYHSTDMPVGKVDWVSDHLSVRTLYLAGVYLNSADFTEGDPITFKIAGKQFEGSMIRVSHDLASKHFFSISGDSAAAILDKLAEPSKLFNASLAGDASARNKMKVAMRKGNSSGLHLEGKTRHGEDVRVEIQEDLPEQQYDAFKHCMEGVNAAGEKRSEIVEKGPAEKTQGDWRLVSLFGSHIQIPSSCEIDEKEGNSAGITYVCGRYGASKNVIGSVITIGPISRVDTRYLASVRRDSISRESRCDVDIYHYMIGGAPLYFIENENHYMKLQSVDRDQIDVLLEPLCRSRAR